MKLNLSQFDAAIVDLDGTMVDTLGDFVVALNLMLGDLSLPAVDRPTVERLVGKGSEHLIKSVLAHMEPNELAINVIATNSSLSKSDIALDGARYDAAWASYQRHYAAINGQHADVFPGVVEGLEMLRGRALKLACLTNKPTVFALDLLKTKGLDRFFELTFGGDAFERKKPDPLPLLKTCEALGTMPGRTLMIGDSSNDAQAARAAGCPVVLVTYGYNHGEPVERVDADGFIDSLTELT